MQIFRWVTSEELDLVLLFEVFFGVIFVLANTLLVIELKVQTSGVGFWFLFIAEIQKAAGKSNPLSCERASLVQQWFRSGRCGSSGLFDKWVY